MRAVKIEGADYGGGCVEGVDRFALRAGRKNNIRKKKGQYITLVGWYGRPHTDLENVRYERRKTHS